MTTTERLVVELAGKIPAGWADAISAVDRARFIPARVWVYDEANTLRPLDRDTDPRWWEVAHSDTAIMTQFDDGATVWPEITGMHPTSSASQPSLVLDMLAALDARQGHRVLEIGTGAEPARPQESPGAQSVHGCSAPGGAERSSGARKVDLPRFGRSPC